jgi:hypothetical protein
MSIDEIARMLDTHVLPPQGGVAGGATQVSRAVASDRMSDLLEHASPSTLIVTRLATQQLLDLAELMDVSAVCIVSEAVLSPAFRESASRCRAAVILSPLGLDETRRRLSDLLHAEAHAPP